MNIKSDNQAVTKEFEAISKLLCENGAWFHENLDIVCEKGDLSLQTNGPVGANETILKVPQELFVPAEPLHLALKDTRFTINPDQKRLSPLQIKLAEHMINLFNLTDKASFHQQESPALLYKDHPELITPLFKGRSTERQSIEKIRFLTNDPQARPHNDFVCWSFLETRVLLCGQQNRQLVLMPILDCLNHSPNGSPYLEEREKDRSILAIKNRQPFLSRNECFAFYGLYDALDTFLHYGFLEQQTPFVRSIPIDAINIGSYGRLKINSLSGMSYGGELPEQAHDLKPLMPHVDKKPEVGALEISHIFIPVISTPHAMRRILQLVINTIVDNKESARFIAEQVYKVEKEILDKNIAFYHSALSAVQTINAPAELKAKVIEAATVQLNKLHKYLYKDDFFKV